MQFMQTAGSITVHLTLAFTVSGARCFSPHLRNRCPPGIFTPCRFYTEWKICIWWLFCDWNTPSVTEVRRRKGPTCFLTGVHRKVMSNGSYVRKPISERRTQKEMPCSSRENPRCAALHFGTGQEHEGALDMWSLNSRNVWKIFTAVCRLKKTQHDSLMHPDPCQS